MNRFIASLVGCFFFCMATVFASTDSVNTPNWTDLLLKSVNFFIFFGLLWFFFRKKIVAALRGIAQGEYKLFFSALNKKKQLEEELKSIYQKLNQKKEEIEERKKSYQDEVEEEKKTMELRTCLPLSLKYSPIETPEKGEINCSGAGSDAVALTIIV